MADSNSIENFCEFLNARCGAPPSRYDDAGCKKKSVGKQKCAAQCRTAAVTGGRQAKADAKQPPPCRQARPDAAPAKKKPPSPWAPAEECADDAGPRRRRESDEDDVAADSPPSPPPPPPPPPSLCCEDRWCACLVRRHRCQDDPRRRLEGAATTSAAAAKRRARKSASGCDGLGGDDDDGDCRCRCRSRRDGSPRRPSAAVPVRRRYGAAIDWVRGSAWYVVLAAVAFFAGMYANDYCRCAYDDE